MHDGGLLFARAPALLGPNKLGGLIPRRVMEPTGKRHARGNTTRHAPRIACQRRENSLAYILGPMRIDDNPQRRRVNEIDMSPNELREFLLGSMFGKLPQELFVGPVIHRPLLPGLAETGLKLRT
jgi:hypothetical protein